jgi:accessory colonization factor AcfC
MKALILILICILPAFVQAQLKQDTLYDYGPGGPCAAKEEWAKVFSMRNSIPVKVTAEPEAKWIDQAKQNADFWQFRVSY